MPAPAEDDGILRITTAAQPPVEEARRVLFVIDDQEFTVPKVIDERLVYLAVESMRNDGAVFSGQRLVELLLGKPQYSDLLALYEQKKINQENFDAIVRTVSNLFFDHMNSDEDAAGKATAAS
ncbi:hypothetical protein SMD44_00918 [Streptomyces alboflavus]|uniref:Uncharacterized protein n=1 Tax=Streptomyces alboflavus TaxID=67267 RepID=A0A1Z1W540_9ACTN|nr:hypothetical protein SMD44_00918 [Streptomyces alboflavus]